MVQLQAVESKKEDAKIAYVEKGLEVAVTDAARAKLVRPHYCSSFEQWSRISELDT